MGFLNKKDFISFLVNLTHLKNAYLIEALAKVIFVILSEAKDLDSSVAYGSLRMTDM